MKRRVTKRTERFKKDQNQCQPDKSPVLSQDTCEPHSLRRRRDEGKGKEKGRKGKWGGRKEEEGGKKGVSYLEKNHFQPGKSPVLSQDTCTLNS